MARPPLPPNERKQAVTISLAPTDLVILDNLAKHLKTNRSQVISQMLVAKGWKDLGLKATEGHNASVQNWPNKYQCENYLKVRFDPEAPTACNPHLKDGRCSHTDCMIVYRKYGVV